VSIALLEDIREFRLWTRGTMPDPSLEKKSSAYRLYSAHFRPEYSLTGQLRYRVSIQIGQRGGHPYLTVEKSQLGLGTARPRFTQRQRSLTCMTGPE
jgi:hypothetical protein